jgi:N-acyl homoserine lactone hydrolase
MRLHPLRTGAIPMPPGYVYRSESANLAEALGRGVPRDSMLPGPVGAFLLEHPRSGPILIDTGMHPVTASHPSRNLGRIMSIAFKALEVGPDENVPAQLAERGISPREIETVVMTHLHADHTSAMSEFPGATFVSTQREWKAARSRLGVTSGYVSSHLPAERAMRFVDFEDHSQPFGELPRTIDLLGDGAIRLVSTPGHTVDHLSVLAETDRGPVFLLGDVVYTLRNLREDLLPWRTHDDDASLQSMAEVRAYARAHEDVRLVPTHDGDAWDALIAAG